MAQLNKNELASKLLKQRGLTPVEPGNDGPVFSTSAVNGHESKLTESGRYLKAARICLLTWVRDHYRDANNVDSDTDSVSEILSMASQLENLRARVDVKASILGK
jgi:hypothetical protein